MADYLGRQLEESHVELLTMPRHFLSRLSVFIAAMLICASTVVGEDLGDIPGFKWSQDEDTLYITIDVQCKNETIDIAADKDFFGFSCTSMTDGRKKTLAFSPREDIVPDTARCAGEEGISESCSLKKVHRHYFDRLWAPKDDNKLTAKARVDWKAMNDVEVEDFYGYSTRHIKTFSSSDLESLKEKAEKKKKPLVLDVSFPWCAKCKDARELFEIAGKKLHKKAYFGYVDAREERQLARDFEADCTFVCPFQVKLPGEDFYVVNAKDGMKSIEFVKLLESHLKPAVETVTSIKAANKLVSKFGVVIASTLPKYSKASIELTKAAREYKDAAFVLLEGEAKKDKRFGNKKGVFAMVPKTKKVITYPEGQTVEEAPIIEFARRAAIPPMQIYTFELRQELSKANIPVVKVFIDDEDSRKIMKTLKKLATEFRGRLATLIMKGQAYHIDMEDAGLPKDKLPAIAIYDNADGKPPQVLRYAYAPGVISDDFSESSLRKFYNDYLDGHASPSFKSQPIPEEEWTVGKVGEVVFNMLDRTVLGHNSGMDEVVGDVILMVYKDWTPGKEKHMKTLERLGYILKDFGIYVGTFDGYENFFDDTVFPNDDENWQDVKVYLIKGDSPESRSPLLLADNSPWMDIPFTQGNVLKKLKEELPVVNENWDKVKSEVEIVRRMAAEERERKKIEEEEAKKKATEEKEKLEERLKTIPKVDLTKDEDKGAIKQVIEQGEGEVPKKGDSVKAHYVGTLMDGTVFDSSRKHNAPFDFVVGEGRVIKCWDLAFTNMKVGEKAVLTCQPEYAYGENGSPPTIPPDATLRFDVELLSFEPKMKDEL